MQQLSYFELIGFGPNGWGWALLTATGMTIAVAICGFLAGSVVGTFVAWAQDRRQCRRPQPCGRIHHRPARHPRPSRDLPLLFRRQRGARRHRQPVRRRGLHRRAGLRHRRAGHRHRVGRLSGGGLPRRLPGRQPRRARGGALGRHASLAHVPPHHRAAGSALRDSGPRQYLAAGPEGIGADLRHRASSSCCASRISPPARRAARSISTSRRPSSTSSSPGFRPTCSSARRPHSMRGIRRAS